MANTNYVITYPSSYDKGRFDVLDELSGAYYGKDMYFLQDDGTVYSRISGNTMSVMDAVYEFEGKMIQDGDNNG